MRKISAQYILPVSSPPLKQGIVTLDASGRVLDLTDTGGQLDETGKLEFYNGIITPGFILPCYHTSPETLQQPNRQHIPDDPSTFRELDSWLSLNGVRGVGLMEKTGAHFREKQNSPVHYHTIIELCPPKDHEFPAFQSAVNTLTHAWNNHEQSGSISGCPASWMASGLPPYLLEYLSTHQSLIILRETPENPQIPLDKQVAALNREWIRLNEEAPEDAPPVPGHLILSGSDFTIKTQSGKKITIPGLKTFQFPQLPELCKIGNNTGILKSLYKLQTLNGCGFEEILPLFTTEAARAIFAEESLGSIEPGKTPGLNLISGVEFVKEGLIKIDENSKLKTL